MTDIYRNAFTEVYEIINYLDKSDYNKLPRKIINVIEENRNQDYKYFLDESISFEEQEMLPETKAILFNFFRDYLSTKEQKEKIISFQRRQKDKFEEENIKIYNVDIFRKKEINNAEEIALIKIEKDKKYNKIWNCIKRILNKVLNKKNHQSKI